MYRVTWECDFSADSYRAAAEQANEALRAPNNELVYFGSEKLSTGTRYEIDLMDPDDDPQDSALEQLAEEAE